MGGVLEYIYADEFWVVATNDAPDGSFLDLPWPFEIPPEYGEDAVATSDMQAGVAVCNANGLLAYKMDNGTCLEGCVSSKGTFNGCRSCMVLR